MCSWNTGGWNQRGKAKFCVLIFSTMLQVPCPRHQSLQLFCASSSPGQGAFISSSVRSSLNFAILFCPWRLFHEWLHVRCKFLVSVDLTRGPRASAPSPSMWSTRRSTWCSGSPLSWPPCSACCNCCTRHSSWRLHFDPILSLVCRPLLWLLVRWFAWLAL